MGTDGFDKDVLCNLGSNKDFIDPFCVDEVPVCVCLEVDWALSRKNCVMLLALLAPASIGNTSLNEVIDEFRVPDVLDGDTIPLLEAVVRSVLLGLEEAVLFAADVDVGTVL